jgi:hypothetical protein
MKTAVAVPNQTKRISSKKKGGVPIAHRGAGSGAAGMRRVGEGSFSPPGGCRFFEQ